MDKRKMSMTMKQFMKVYSQVPNGFIDDLFSIYDENTTQTDFVMDVERVASWLDVPKGSLVKTLMESYKSGVDYKVSKPRATKKHGGSNHLTILLTPDCFKRLCMRSRSKKAEDVRSYFINLEALIMKYRVQMMEGMQDEMERMERRLNGRRKLKSAHKPLTGSAGYIYVLRASHRFDKLLVKIGKARDVAKRLRQHGTPLSDDLDVLYIFRTDDVDAVESCVKVWMRDEQTQRGREIYEVDVETVKAVIGGCDGVGRLKAEYIARKPATMTGGYLIELHRTDEDIFKRK